MAGQAGVGRIAVVDRSEEGRRVVRTVRALEREGLARGVVVLHRAEKRATPAMREADEALEIGSDLAAALARAGADTAWLGPAPLAERAAFAEACARAGVAAVGPTLETLRRLAAPGALAALAAELGVPAADPARLDDGARLVEVVVARDRRGEAAALATGDASLRAGGAAVLVAAPALQTERDAAARALAERAASTAGWTGLCAVQLVDADGAGPLALAGLDAFAASAPAIEEATGLDLVRLALELAAGGPVPVATPRRVHALAARVFAGDPARAGADAGPVELVRLAIGPGVCAEATLVEGDLPASTGGVLAILVAHGADRAEAARRLEAALADTAVVVRGDSEPNAARLRALCARPEVRTGEARAGLAAQAVAAVERRPEVALLAAALASYEAELDLERARFIAEARRGRPKVGPSSGRWVELRLGDERHRLEVRQIGPETYRVASADGAAADVRIERLGRFARRLTWPSGRARVLLSVDGPRHLVVVDGVPHVVLREPAGLVRSPMPAVVVSIPVEPGQRVEAGEPVARIESMKVEMVVAAPEAGIVREVVTVPNAQVDEGAPLVRLEPAGDAALAHAAEAPLALGGAAPEPTGPVDRYVAALEDLRRLVLGFDVTAAEARRLGAGLRELAAALPPDAGAALAAEDEILAAFAEVQSLYSRERPREGGADAKPPLEELWRYLHEPERRGEGLSPGFVAALRRALARYGLSLDEPDRALEIALLRMQKAYERADAAAPPLVAILERRLAGPGLAPGAGTAPRAVLAELAAIGEERFPSLGDLAREVRYRSFDEPVLDRLRAEAYAQAERDLARIGAARGEELEALLTRLVECRQPLATLLVSRMAGAAPPTRARLVEALLRRYYRVRALEGARTAEVDGLPVAWVEYEHEGRHVRVAACFARPDGIPDALAHLARLAAEVPADRDLAVELYVWHDAPLPAADALAKELLDALRAAAFPRPIRRASFALAIPGRGLATNASQAHFTFRGGPDAWAEDRNHRGVHPMLFKRMMLGRLSRFELERLPSVEDVYLYRGVARDNPKDERLFAVAEVREITPVRDRAGWIVQLPHIEWMFLEAVAGMRRFQARRAPTQRLEWNRVFLIVGPPLEIGPGEILAIAQRLLPASAGAGLEMVLIDARVPDPATGEVRERLLRVAAVGREVSVRWDEPTDRPLQPMTEYEQKVVALRRRGLTHPFEVVKMLAPASRQGGVPRGEFVEHDLDASGALVPVKRPPGGNAANIVVGLVRSFTDRHPEGMLRVALLGDPSRAMGSLAEPECRRIEAGLLLAEKLGVPLEWFAVSAGAKISMESGTENMDWISQVLRRIVEFTQRGGEINVVVCGINVGAQPYWNAEATMLMHTRGILVMVPGSAMVLTGKEALEYSGSVSAEDNSGIGGYERIMGPNGQAQYRAGSIDDAIGILLQHYEHAYVVPGERFPRRAATTDPRTRDVRSFPHGPEGGAGFETVGEVFSRDKNPDRKKPFAIRRIMAACVDQDHAPLERWHDMRGGETAVVWDAHLGGWPVLLLGIESRPLPRLAFVPADGPSLWSAGTLFPSSSKKIARALSAASGNRPAVVLANLSGFDGSPESMRRLQLEYGAEIGRAVVNFAGPIVFCVVSRYHGGAFVVFSKTLREDIEVVAVEGARASVIGGAPAAAVVFAREVETRLRKDPRVQEAEKAAQAGGAAARARYLDLLTMVRSEKIGVVAEEFDAVHSVERALKVGSLDRIIAPETLRPYLVDAVERGIARATQTAKVNGGTASAGAARDGDLGGVDLPRH